MLTERIIFCWEYYTQLCCNYSNIKYFPKNQTAKYVETFLNFNVFCSWILQVRKQRGSRNNLRALIAFVLPARAPPTEGFRHFRRHCRHRCYRYRFFVFSNISSTVNFTQKWCLRLVVRDTSRKRRLGPFTRPRPNVAGRL